MAGAIALAVVFGPRFCRAPLLPAGAEAPPFSLDRPDRPGERLTAGDLRGRRSVLFFWTVWCPACDPMLAPLDALARRRPDVLVAAIHSDGDADPARVARRAAGAPALVHVSGGDRIMGSYRISVFPTTYVVDSAGRICAGFSGRTSAGAISGTLDACR